MKLKDLLKGVLGQGIMFRWSTGKPFNPHTQTRTSAMEDLVKGKNKIRDIRRKNVESD